MPRPKATSRYSISRARRARSAASRGGWPHRFPIKVVRFDVERQQPVRDAQGFCIECDADEPGEVIGKIMKDPVEARSALRGLCQRDGHRARRSCATCSRRATAWFRTGDLMRKDKDGYFYFIDRIGDTFRWKGENVSTTEVEEAIGSVRRHPGGQRLRRRRRRPRRPRRDGGDRREGQPQPRGVARPSRAAAAGICPAGVPARAPATSMSPRPSSRRRSIS